MSGKMPNNKKEDFYAVVSAIVKFIEKADASKPLTNEGNMSNRFRAQISTSLERNDLVENSK